MTVDSNTKTFGSIVRQQAKDFPNKVAFSTLDGGQVSFSAFEQRICRLADAILSLGLEAGDRVAILAFNRVEYVEVYGLSDAHLIVVPLNWRLRPEELARLIGNSSPKVIFVDEAHREVLDLIRVRIPEVQHFILFGPAAIGWRSYEELLASARPACKYPRAGERDVLSLIYTSGTIGAPKGVEITHSGAVGNARSAATDLLSLSNADTTMALMPMFHAGGMWYHLFASFSAGCTTLILDKFDPAVVLTELSRREITNVHLVPTMIGALLSHPNISRTNLNAVRKIFYAASSIPTELLRRAMETFPHSDFIQSYGSTEAGVLTVLDPAAHRKALTPGNEHLLKSCGRPVNGRRLRIAGANDRLSSPGEVGEIEALSPDMMRGYWLNADATANALNDGWMRTGDLGYVDADGYFYVIDRKSDMIVTGGENVFPSEVESELYGDDDIVEAAVFGLPDPVWIERVVAAIVLRPNATRTTASIDAHLRGRLAAYKCPKEIFLVPSLPKNPAGKILRKELRQQYASNR